ncbi:MAG TPA: hypothetical protein VFA99_16725 [Acidobacteriaceae bacterium]|nr:hypothetical protein [Acidobacteriaceae bacterium]
MAAQASDWPVQRMHAPSSSLSRLSQADQAIAVKLLRPELGPLFQGDAISVLDKQIRSFRAERLNLGGSSALAVQPDGGELCGATGNCSFWVIDLSRRRVLLRADGIQGYAVDPAKPRSVPDIVTATHESSTEYEKIHWVFLNGRYERQSCATVDYADRSGAQLPQPKVTPHSCSPEGN